MELCDLYDANRRPLGITVPRGTALQPGQYLLAAGVWVFNSKNEILLTRRSLQKKFMPGRWETTGGHVQAGETTAQAAARELLEETGILCTADQLQLIGTTVRQSYIGDDFALRRDLPAERVRLQPGETCDAMWVSEEKLDQMIASGELAPSVAASLAPIRQRFSELLQGSGET